ncbi:MAG: hypothetical protein VCE91_15165 [Nitrospinota bacterium]
MGRGFDRDGITPSAKQLMSVVRVYLLVGRKTPDIRIEGSEVRIKCSAQVIQLRFDEK